MRFFVAGLIIGLAIILLSENGFLANFEGMITTGPEAAGGGPATVPGTPGATVKTGGGCDCSCNSSAVAPEPSAPVTVAPSSPWSGFGGNPNYEGTSLQILTANQPITNPSRQAY